MNLDKIYTYHAPKEGQAITYGLIRDTAKELAKMIEVVSSVYNNLSTAIVGCAK